MSKPTEDQIIAFMARKLSDLQARDWGISYDFYWDRWGYIFMRDCTALWYELRELVDIKENPDET